MYKDRLARMAPVFFGGMIGEAILPTNPGAGLLWRLGRVVFFLAIALVFAYGPSKGREL